MQKRDAVWRCLAARLSRTLGIVLILVAGLSACAGLGLGPEGEPSGGSGGGFYGQSHGEPDEDAVLEWTRLAGFGDAEAQFQMGVIYEKGRVFPRNPVDAARWYRDAMDNGLAKGAYNLGLLHMRGAGVAKDPARAAKLFERAAKDGSGRAMLSLGSMYETGIGVARDPVTAYRWYGMAAKALPPEERGEANRRAKAVRSKFVD